MHSYKEKQKLKMLSLRNLKRIMIYYQLLCDFHTIFHHHQEIKNQLQTLQKFEYNIEY